MEGKVEAVPAGKKMSSLPADGGEEEDAMATASSSSASIFAFLALPLSVLCHVACLCAGYLGRDGGLKPSSPAPAPSSSLSSSSTAAAACRRGEVEAAASIVSTLKNTCILVFDSIRSHLG
jgi:hypothetical protein